MRVKFSIDPDNNVTIINEDQPDTYVRVVSDGDDKVVTVSAVWTDLDLPIESPSDEIEEEV